MNYSDKEKKIPEQPLLQTLIEENYFLMDEMQRFVESGSFMKPIIKRHQICNNNNNNNKNNNNNYYYYYYYYYYYLLIFFSYTSFIKRRKANKLVYKKVISMKANSPEKKPNL